MIPTKLLLSVTMAAIAIYEKQGIIAGIVYLKNRGVAQPDAVDFFAHWEDIKDQV